MSRLNTFNLSAITMAVIAGIYTGTRFYEPIVIAQLEKDGHIRKDIEIPQYDSEGNLVNPRISPAPENSPPSA